MEPEGTRDIGEDTMFSCCLPLYRDQGLKRSSHKSGFHGGPRYFDPQRRPVSPLKWLEPESSTRVIKEQQLVDEDPGPAFFTEGQLGHSSEGQRRPKVHFASCGSGEPGPSSGRRWTPAQKPTRFCRPPTWNQRQNRVLSSILDPDASPRLESPRVPRRFPACAYIRQNAHRNHSWPEYLEPEEAEPKAPAQEAEEAPAETPEVQTEKSDEESDEELEAWAPPEVLPPPPASPVAAVEPGPAWEAPADMTEAPPPLDEEPSLEPALGPASEEELPPETPAAPAPEPQAEAARCLPSEKVVLPSLVDLFLLFSFLFMIFLSSWGSLWPAEAPFNSSTFSTEPQTTTRYYYGSRPPLPQPRGGPAAPREGDCPERESERAPSSAEARGFLRPALLLAPGTHPAESGAPQTHTDPRTQ
ncbi:hypothetical protein QTO34_005489 [Cnephaeus nilssonii]|uniref:Uncharacterized protein n=1 Tax=Cnephaeus nilssonii TaxID=3371016 RepID=A0AA40LK13_CNENI|nr:hypothetical protein QTO34_005489 [Eptesicus nilssonii]